MANLRVDLSLRLAFEFTIPDNRMDEAKADFPRFRDTAQIEFKKMVSEQIEQFEGLVENSIVFNEFKLLEN